MSYEDFIRLTGLLRLVKSTVGPLYGHWKQYGDTFGEPRTVRECLAAFGWELFDPTKNELAD